MKRMGKKAFAFYGQCLYSNLMTKRFESALGATIFGCWVVDTVFVESFIYRVDISRAYKKMSLVTYDNFNKRIYLQKNIMIPNISASTKELSKEIKEIVKWRHVAPRHRFLRARSLPKLRLDRHH